MNSKKQNWLKLVFRLKGSVILAMEIENPFGYDTNDLPLDAICETIKYDIEEFIKNSVDCESNSDQMY
ncbi:MAG: hypothetical protein RLZZ507_2819 [Cyanobacteriota bacterium]|jgi:putative membrane protein